jgi:hypothetical protein
MTLGSTQPLVKMSTRNISGGKGGRCVRLTTSPTSRAESHEIWVPKPPGTLWGGGGTKIYPPKPPPSHAASRKKDNPPYFVPYSYNIRLHCQSFAIMNKTKNWFSTFSQSTKNYHTSKDTPMYVLIRAYLKYSMFKKTKISLTCLKQYIVHLRQECHNSKFGIFLFIGKERNVCRRILNRYSVITQFVKLAAGEQLCRRCTHRKL